MAQRKSPLDLTIRPAGLGDVPAITSLVLTSFSTFPLFDFLYAPLHDHLDNAHDTAYFWGRRVQLAIYDPAAMVMVAEVQSRDVKPPSDAADVQSCSMLKWTVESGRLSQVRDHGSVTVVGFAIWRWRGLAAESDVADVESTNLLNRAWTTYIRFETWLWNKLYTRKDQDPARYAAYSTAEADAEKRYYTAPCLQLDNLCTDFRVQHSGVGRALVECGMEKAKKCRLPVQTEASPDGTTFYQKFGFQRIGEWTIRSPQESSDEVQLLVLKIDAEAEESANLHSE